MNKTQSSLVIDPAQKPRRLGRGLSALLGEPVSVQVPATPGHAPAPHAGPSISDLAAAEHSFVPPSARPELISEPPGTRVLQVPLDSAEPNRFQPRRTFDESQLAELAASIKSAGVVQPILLRPAGPGQAAMYEIIAGERRWRACKLAGLTHIPAIIAPLTDEQSAEWALVENIQRADLSPMERAWAVRGLAERFGLSHAQIGERLGIDRSSAANLARLTELEKDIHELLDAGQLSAGHGKVLLGLSPGAVRVGLAKQAAGQGWSVRRLEQAAARAAEAPAGPAPEVRIGESAIAKAAAMKDLERQLGEHLGTSVRIRASAGGKRGSLVIKFFDLDHFDGLMSKIGFVLR